MELREAAQMALDALITAEREGNCEYGATDALRARLAQPIQPDWSKAGFGQPQQPEPEKSLSQRMREAGFTPRDTRLECDGCGKKFSRLMLPIHDCDAAQPEPEPVAWMHNFIDEVAITHRPADLDRHPDRWTPLYKDPTPCQTCEALARSVMMDQTSHDIPPQREWVGLTDEEMRQAAQAMDAEPLAEGWQELNKFACAIEQALKEKNGG